MESKGIWTAEDWLELGDLDGMLKNKVRMKPDDSILLSVHYNDPARKGKYTQYKITLIGGSDV